MNQLRMGRFALLFGMIGLVVIGATFYLPAVAVLCGVFALVAVLLGVCGVRTRAGRIGLGVAFVLLPGLAFVSYRYHREPVGNPPRNVTEVYFSPNGGCTNAIVSEIRKSRHNILVQAYWLTSKPIAQSLVDAKKCGVEIHILLDSRADSEKYTEATFFSNAGIDTGIDTSHKIAHDKVMLIDSAVVITGSFNFSAAAEDKNAENLLILRDVALAKTYIKNWNVHAKHSYRYTRGTSATTGTENLSQ